MKLFVLLFIGVIRFSEEKPATPETTTTESLADDKSSSVTENWVILEPEDIPKIISSTEKVVKNSSQVDDSPTEVQLPVDLFSDDILLDPSVILARVERSARSLESAELPESIRDSLDVYRFNDDNPTFYFVRFVRVPRSAVDTTLEPEKNERLRIPEEEARTAKRFSRSAENDETEDLYGADDGFIIRPLFKYRREQLKRSNRRGYRYRNSYSYYPRYPVFPGK